jgi:hypothetical protein
VERALLGLVGACSELVKQNFVDALVFAVVLVSAAAINGALAVAGQRDGYSAVPSVR